MTAQQARQVVFDRVWDHFVTKKNPRAVSKYEDRDDVCFYRTKEGNRCAIGLLIPDAEYRPEMDEPSLNGLRQACDLSPTLRFIEEACEAEASSGYTSGYTFLAGLQRCHDIASDALDMAGHLRIFAGTYGLELPS